MFSRNKFRKTRSKKGGESGKTPVDDCSICQEPMDNIDNLITTDCNHTFHKDCLRRWCRAQARNECPLCRENIANICSSLIEQYIDSATRVFNAIENNNLNEVKEIIEIEIQNTGGNDHFFSSRDPSDNTFLMAAITVGNIDIVRYLLDLVNNGTIPNINGTNFLDLVREDTEETALHIAIDKNNMDIVNMLLESPININTYNSDGNNVVVYAVEKNNLELVKKLVDKGAILYGDRIIDYQPIVLYAALSKGINIAILEYLFTLSPERLGPTYKIFMKHASWALGAYANNDDFSSENLEILQQYIANKQLRTTGGKLRSTKKRRTIRKKNKKPTRKARK